LVSGFEYRTLQCLDCGDTEQRLVFGNENISPAQSLSGQAPAPSEQRLVSANYDISAAENLSAQAPPPSAKRLVSANEDISTAQLSARAPTPSEQGLVSCNEDNSAGQSLSTQSPAPSVLPAESIRHEPAAISNAWAQTLGKLQQRCAALAQETARERAAEIGKRATKAAIARSQGLLKSVGGRAPPPRAPMSKVVIANSLKETADFDRLWDSLAGRAAPPCGNRSSPQQVTQPDALTQTSQPDLVLSVPTRSEGSQEHQDQTPKVPAILRDSSAPCVLPPEPSRTPISSPKAGIAPPCTDTSPAQEVTLPDALTQTPEPDLMLSVPTRSERSQEHQDQTPKLSAILPDSSAPCVPLEPYGEGKPEAPRTVMAMLLRARVRASMKGAILQTNAETLRMKTHRIAQRSFQPIGMLRRLVWPR
jgi:hypothetical protein